MSSISAGQTTTVRRWGNSQGIRLPKELLDKLHISLNEELSIQPVHDGILLRKTVIRKSLEEYASPFGGLGQYEEFNWGDGMGFERWTDESSN